MANLKVEVQDGNNLTVEVVPQADQVIVIDRGISSGGGTGVTSVTATAPVLSSGGSAPDISIPVATTAADGYLSSTDWTTFNNKVGSVTSTDGSVTVTGTTTRDLSVNTSKTVITEVRNATGATLLKGTAVYITGAIGQLPTVSKAQANSDATSAQTLGLITADLANNSNGYVTLIGLLTNLNTSAYTDGQQLYLSPTVAGGLTATKPAAPSHLVYVAVVEHAHITQGKLFVKVQNGYELDELHDVSITSPLNGQSLVFDSATSLWKNQTITAGISGSGTTNYVTKFTGSTAIGNSLIYDDGTNVGIGTSSPSTKLHVQGASGTAAEIRATATDTASNSRATIRLFSATSTFGAGLTLTNNSDTAYPTNALNLYTFDSQPLIFGTSNAERMRINSSGHVGIGTSSPSTKLIISGYTTSTVAADFVIERSGAINELVGQNPSIQLNNTTVGTGVILQGSGNTFQVFNFTGGSWAERMRIDTSGNLGIGTSSPIAKIDLGTGVGRKINVYTDPTDALIGFGIDIGGGNYELTSFAGGLGAGKGKFTWQQYNRTTDTYTEFMRIDSNGNVGIGTSSPIAKLDVATNGVSQLSITNTSGTTKNTQLLFTDNSAVRWRVGMDIATNNNTNIFQIYNDATSSSAISVNSSGNVGIGTSSPSTKLDVNGGITGTTVTTTVQGLYTNPAVPTNDGIGIIECVDDGLGDGYNELQIYVIDQYSTKYAPFFPGGIAASNFVIRSQDWTTNYKYVILQVPSGMSAPYTLTLPTSAGSNNQVLKTDGSGNLSWTNTLSGFQAAVTADPSAPSNGNVAVYGRAYGGYNTLAARNALNTPFGLQSALWSKNIQWWTTTAATAGLWIGASGTGNGTYANANPTLGGTKYQTIRRSTYASSATVNLVQGIVNGQASFFRGNVAGQGGFFFYTRCGFDTWTNGGRFFAGFSVSAVGSTDPSTVNQTVGFCVDAADNGAISFLTRGSAATKASTGYTIVTNKGYDCYIYCAPNSSQYTWEIVDINAGTSATGTATLNLPSATNAMFPQVISSNAALTTVAAIKIGVASIYIESDY